MYRNDIFNLNNAYFKVVTEGTVDLGPQADSQQGLSPVIQTVIKPPFNKKKEEESCEDCGGTCGCNSQPGSNADKDEIEMSKNELYNTISHAVSLYNKLDKVDNLEAWVRAKITKAADYLNSIKHYLDHEDMIEPQHEQNEEQDIAFAFDKGSDQLISQLSNILSRESKENLEKILFEVVQLIEKKS